MTPQESLTVILTPAEYDNVAQALTAAPASAIVGTWLDRAGVALVLARIEGEVVGYLLTPAPNADEGKRIATEVADQLASDYAAVRDAGEAARLLLRRISH